MVKRLTIIALALAIVVSLAGIAGAANKSPKGQVVVGILSDIETLNPILSENSSESQILQTLFNNLLRVDDTGNLIPDLATKVPTVENGGISKDGLVYTFNLRTDVEWHDGKPFTADDVEFTWQISMHKDVQVVTRDGFDNIVKMEKPNKYTVKMYLKEKSATFIYTWAAGAQTWIVPKHILGKVKPSEITKGGDFSHEPIGTGAFKFKEWKADSHIIVEANKTFWGKGPYLERIVYRVVPNTNTMLNLLRTGEVQIFQPGADLYPEVKKISSLKVTLSPADIYLHITPNLKNPILADKKVRQALSYAIPREQIVENLLHGVGTPAYGSIAPTNWAHEKNVQKYPFDLKKAAALLKEAGWADTNKDGILDKGGKPFKLRISTNTGNVLRERIEQVLQQEWKKLGIELVIDNYEGNTLFGDILENMKFDLIMFGWISPPDPDPYTLYHSKQIPNAEKGLTGQNYSSYVNKRVDELIDKGRATLVQSERKKYYSEIQKICAEELPMFYVYYYTEVSCAPKTLKNWKPVGTTTSFAWNANEWSF